MYTEVQPLSFLILLLLVTTHARLVDNTHLAPGPIGRDILLSVVYAGTFLILLQVRAVRLGLLLVTVLYCLKLIEVCSSISLLACKFSRFCFAVTIGDLPR